MSDPLSINGIGPGQSSGQVGGVGRAGPVKGPDGQSFKDTLLDSLNQVNQLQKEAAQGVEKTGHGRDGTTWPRSSVRFASRKWRSAC